MKKENDELSQMGVLDCAAKTRVSDLGLKQTEKAVLLTLCMHIYKDISNGYYCNPAIPLIASETGLTDRTVSRCIVVLRELNYIKSSATKYSNTYYINAEKIIEKHNMWRQSFKDKPLADATFKTVSKSALKGFDKAENKQHDYKRNTSGLNQGKIQPKPSPTYDDLDCPF
jgi:hypothetical protein